MRLRDYAQAKANEYTNDLMVGGKARSNIGAAQAVAMVSTAAANLDLLTGGLDPIATAIKTFSQQRSKNAVKRFSDNPYYQGDPSSSNAVNPAPAMNDPAGNNIAGISSVTNLQTISAIDITYQMLIYSFLPWIAIERAMTDSTMTISWREIIATSDAAGVAKGDTLIGNFNVESSDINLNTPLRSVTAAGDGGVMIIDFGDQIYDGTVLVTVNTGAGTIVGKDYQGLIQFPGISLAFNVDYANGVLTSTAAVAGGNDVTAQAMIDMWASKTASSVLRTTTNMRSVQMISRESGIIIEDSQDRMMYILKTLEQSGGAVTIEQYMQQMLFDLYVAYVNNLLLSLIHARSQQLEGTPALQALTLDLSAYGAQIIAEPNRKYDELSQLLNTADQQMLSTVNRGVTSWIGGSRIVQIMGSDAYRFKKSDTFSIQMNTLCGVYDGRPVLRHQYIDKYIDAMDIADNGGWANIYGVHRDPGGEVGFAAYGEFLPIHTSDNIYNFANPLQFARALMSQIGCRVIEPGLCVRARFRLVRPV